MVSDPVPWPVIRVPAARSSWGTQQINAAIAPTSSATWSGMALAAVSITAVLAAMYLGSAGGRFARVVALIGWAARFPARAATSEQVRWALDCVRACAGVIPARIACLEETTAAALLLASLGRGVGWCHGAAAEPARLHAWITPLQGFLGESETTRYTPLHTITPVRCAT
ncbi:lasso peptide biosynthesis B2 protein [Pseudonocardiaceae bacterium YIM PH 21723]|nr:lasso peptide biosynthesis B2 protein [Pseudonocardiaceae bacterium YIM PH 21723]